MNSKIQITMMSFFKSLLAFNLEFGVTDKGTFVFIDQETGESASIKNEDLKKYYNELKMMEDD